MLPAVEPEFVDPVQRHEMAAVDAYEPPGAPALLQGGQRYPDEVTAGGGVQPGVVPLCLGVRDVVDGHEADDPAQFHRDLVGGRVVDGRGALTDLLGDAPDGLGEALAPHGLEHVVDGLEVERVDGEAFVGGDEDDERRRGEPCQELGDVEPGQPRHVDVQEHHVDRGRVVGPGVDCGPDAAQRLGGSRGALCAPDAGIGAQEVEELLQGGFFVVDGEYAQHEAGV